MKRLSIFNKTYRETMDVVICPRQEFVVWFRRRFGDDLGNRYADLNGETLMQHDKKGCHFIIWMPNFEWRICDQEVLVHEIFHVVVRMLARKNIPFDIEGGAEAHAYLLSFFVRGCFRSLLRLYGKKQTRKGK